MPSLTVEGLSAEALVAVGDTLLQQGQHGAARNAYAAALAEAPTTIRASIMARQGMARYAAPMSTDMLSIQHAIEKVHPRKNAFVASYLAVWGKTNSFLADEKFMRLAREHEHLLPITNWQWNFMAPLWAVAQTRNLPGDYVELGVFKGHTTLFLADYYDFAAWDREWFLYDTFAGVPDDQLNPGWAQANKMAYQNNQYSYAEVRDRFAKFPNIHVIQGRVPEILEERCPEKIAFLHMDLNSAVAEVAALEFILDRVVAGGVIVFDDYGWQTAIAQQTAEKAWFAERGLTVLELPTGQGVFIKGPTRDAR